MLDNATVEAMQSLLNETRTEEGLVVDVEDPVINVLLEALANRAQYLNEVGLEYLISRLKQLYVERLPDKGLSTNDLTDELLEKLMNAASKEELKEAKDTLLDLINAITSFEYLVVSELPSKGKKGTIYLLRLDKFNTTKNLYEEYIWVNDRYELLGMFDTGQDGPFVTVDDLKNDLKAYVKKIKVGTSTISPNTSTGIADISDAIMALVKAQVGTIGSVNSITLNGSSYTPTNGVVTLPTLAHQIKINGSTKTVPATGVIDLGTFAVSDDIPEGGLTSFTVSVNGASYTDTDGTVTLPALAHQVKVNGATYTATAAGLVTLPTLAHIIKINGVSTTVPSNGTIDLGTVGGGGAVRTGTTLPASTLGDNDDFYYKFPS